MGGLGLSPISAIDLMLIKTFTYFRYKVPMSPKKDETAVHYSDPATSALVIFGVSKRLPCSMSLAVYGLHILEPKILCRCRDKQRVRIHKTVLLIISFIRQLFDFSLPHRADETQPGRNSSPRLPFLAFCLDSLVSLSQLLIVSVTPFKN